MLEYRHRAALDAGLLELDLLAHRVVKRGARRDARKTGHGREECARHRRL